MANGCSKIQLEELIDNDGIRALAKHLKSQDGEIVGDCLEGLLRIISVISFQLIIYFIHFFFDIFVSLSFK